MAVLGEGIRVISSTQRLQASVASTATLVAKIPASAFLAVNSQVDMPYHVTWVPGSGANTIWQLLQVRGSTTIVDPTNAACINQMVVQTLANQSWNYDAYFTIGPTDNLYVTMPVSSAATNVAVKIFAEPMI